MSSSIRSAESSRISSCPFPDTIATLSIQEFKRRCPISCKDAYKQTVLAAFLIQDGNSNPPIVVSFGIGTKFLHRELKYEDESHSTRKTETRIRDCHAEILARRALKIYLLQEISNWVSLHFYTSSQPCGNACIKKWSKSKKPPIYQLQHPYTCPVVESQTQTQSQSQCQYPSHSRLFVTAREQGQIAVLMKRDRHNHRSNDNLGSEKRNNLGSEKRNNLGSEKRNNLGSDSLRSQCSVTTHTVVLGEEDKGGIQDSRIQYNGRQKDNDEGKESVTGVRVQVQVQQEIPPGMASVSSGEGCTLSCSDKIALWNTLGVQGSLLTALCGTVYITSCTVGRKFSKSHCERALCCRLQDFNYQGVHTSFTTNHPVMLGTAVKLDETVIVTATDTTGINSGGTNDGTSIGTDGRTTTTTTTTTTSHSTTGTVVVVVGMTGAIFDESRCLIWSYGQEEAEVIDGTTGRVWSCGHIPPLTTPHTTTRTHAVFTTLESQSTSQSAQLLQLQLSVSSSQTIFALYRTVCSLLLLLTTTGNTPEKSTDTVTVTDTDKKDMDLNANNGKNIYLGLDLGLDLFSPDDGSSTVSSVFEYKQQCTRCADYRTAKVKSTIIALLGISSVSNILARLLEKYELITGIGDIRELIQIMGEDECFDSRITVDNLFLTGHAQHTASQQSDTVPTMTIHPSTPIGQHRLRY
eukprot:gene6846-13862_t